jgi:hypothetical protein
MCPERLGRKLVLTPQQAAHRPLKEDDMILATTTIEDLDQFVKIYGTKGADKRKLHGSKGSTVFRDPNETDRLWAIFD